MEMERREIHMVNLPHLNRNPRGKGWGRKVVIVFRNIMQKYKETVKSGVIPYK